MTELISRSDYKYHISFVATAGIVEPAKCRPQQAETKHVQISKKNKK